MRAPQWTKAFFEDFLMDEIWFRDVVALGEVGCECKVEFFRGGLGWKPGIYRMTID